MTLIVGTIPIKERPENPHKAFLEENVEMVKGTTTVYLNSEIVKLSCDLGLNISKTCENALKTAIARLQGNYAETDSE